MSAAAPASLISSPERAQGRKRVLLCLLNSGGRSGACGAELQLSSLLPPLVLTQMGLRSLIPKNAGSFASTGRSLLFFLIFFLNCGRTEVPSPN